MEIGDNVLVDGKSAGTIRYIGTVENHSGQWIGIEWWYQQGKHDGTFQGKFYFQTSKTHSASFIRPERITFGFPFSQAIYRQYVKSFSHQYQQSDIQYSLFGKEYDDYVIELSSLIRVDLSSQWINGFDEENSTLYENLRQLRELNIRQNLIKTWSQLWHILERKFSQLEIFNASNSRITFDQHCTQMYPTMKELVLIDTNNDCQIFEQIIEPFPKLDKLHLDKNRLTFISDNLVNRLEFLTSLALSDNFNLKSWHPFINRLGKLSNLEELFLNNCGIQTIELIQRDEEKETFPRLKSLYLSDNEINSFESIDQLSFLKNLTSFSVLRNPIYPLDPIEAETSKQLIIARIPTLTSLNRVRLERDDRRGAEIDYLQRYAQLYFNQQLNFNYEHRQYLRLIDKYGEPHRIEANQTSKKGLCIRPNLFEITFEMKGEKSLTKKIPPSMSIAKLKTLIKKLYSARFQSNDDQLFHLYLVIDGKHQQILNDDYQDVQFYLDNQFQPEKSSIIRIEFV